MPTTVGWILIAIAIFSVIVGIRIVKRFKDNSEEKKSGCITYGYVILVVFCISFFACFISAFLITSTYSKLDALVSGDPYYAKVVGHNEVEHKDDDGYSTYYQPIYELTLDDGEVITINSDFSSPSGEEIGSLHKVIYNKKNGNLLMLSAMTIIMIVGMMLMTLVLVVLFVGLILFAFGANMTRYWAFCQNFGTTFFIPFVMIAFDALLIYALLFGNRVSTFFSGILLFFIAVLTLAIVGYIKMIRTKGAPNWKRKSATEWTADWDE